MQHAKPEKTMKKYIWIGVGILTLGALFVVSKIMALKDGLKISFQGIALEPDSEAFANIASMPAKVRFKLSNHTSSSIETSALYMEALTKEGKKLGEINMPDFTSKIDKKSDTSAEVTASLKTLPIIELIKNSKAFQTDGSIVTEAKQIFDIAVNGIGEKIRLKGFVSIKPSRFAPSFRKKFDLEVEVKPFG